MKVLFRSTTSFISTTLPILGTKKAINPEHVSWYLDLRVIHTCSIALFQENNYFLMYHNISILVDTYNRRNILSIIVSAGGILGMATYTCWLQSYTKKSATRRPRILRTALSDISCTHQLCFFQDATTYHIDYIPQRMIVVQTDSPARVSPQ
jgi:hypothetical protein